MVAEDQLSLAIGKEGQNVRLAARLTGWKIDIKDIDKYDAAAEDAKIAEDMALREPEVEAIEQEEDLEGASELEAIASDEETPDEEALSEELNEADESAADIESESEEEADPIEVSE